MGLEDRVKKVFDMEKRLMYISKGGGSQPEGINDVYLYVARKFKIPVRQVKDIVNPGGYVDG